MAAKRHCKTLLKLSFSLQDCLGYLSKVILKALDSSIVLETLNCVSCLIHVIFTQLTDLLTGANSSRYQSFKDIMHLFMSTRMAAYNAFT